MGFALMTITIVLACCVYKLGYMQGEIDTRFARADEIMNEIRELSDEQTRPPNHIRSPC